MTCCSRKVKAASFILTFAILSTAFICVNASSGAPNSANENTNSVDIGAKTERLVVNLPEYGMLEGSIGFTAWTNRTIFQFLDIPYAESPSGPRRFKAPVPIKPWNGIRNAKNYGIKCPTFKDLDELIQSERDSEDVENCLNMAIFSTNLKASSPVMVFIHGGRFISGNARSYPPNYLLERDVILVVIQYRLDVLGFLSTNSEEIPGNAGLLDSIQALKFVKENIEHFGGDPGRVTIFGQSSGGVMVSVLVIPCTNPNVPEDLFQRAIMQSGTLFIGWTATDDPVSDARNIAEAAGIDPNQSISALDQAFMAMNVTELLGAVDKYGAKLFETEEYPKGGRALVFGGPSNLLPDLPQNLIKSFSSKKSTDIIIGATKDDGSFGAAFMYDLLTANSKLNDKDYMVNDLIDALRRFSGLNDETGTLESLSSLTYFPSDQLLSGDFGQCAPGIAGMLGTTIFKAPVLNFAQVYARNNALRTFLYTFDYAGEYTNFDNGADESKYPFPGGVTHSDELLYLFPYPPKNANLNEEDTQMAQLMVDLWTSFATDGVPKLPKERTETNALEWEPFSAPLGPYLHIDKELRTDNDYRKEFTIQVQDQQCQIMN